MCLLKFDYFFLIGFSIQLVLLVPTVGAVEKTLTIVALPVTFLLLIVGYYGVRRENKPLVSAFMVGLLSGSSYFIYKVQSALFFFSRFLCFFGRSIVSSFFFNCFELVIH
jgi:hypothetical protein